MVDRIYEQFDDLNRRVAELYAQQQFERAIPVAERSRAVAEQHWGKQHPNYATSLCNLAELHHELGRYAEAEPLYLEAIEIRRRTLGELDPYLAYTLNCLAELYRLTGRYAEAESRQREALEIRRTALGEDHPQFAESVNNLAALYRAMGRLAEAELLYKQAIAIRRAALGESHPDLATSLNNLALLYDSLGRYAEAEPVYLQAIEIWRVTLGEDHSHHAAGLNNLAMLYDSMGYYADAERLYQQALEIWRKIFGERHPNYGSCLNNLAELYRAVGQYELAEPLYLRESEICRATQGDHTPSFAVSLNNLAALYRAMGKHGQAEPLYLQALEVRRATLGEEHPGFAESLSNVAVFYESIGRYDEAERLQTRALEIRRVKLGETHPSLATSLNNLAALYRATGRHAEAEPYYQQALEIRRQTLGDSHPFVAQSLNNLAVFYAATGRPEKSLELMQQAADVHRRLIGQVFAISSERRRLEYLKNIEVQYHAFLTLVWKHLRESPSAVAAALDLVLRRKAISAEALAAQRDAVLAGRYPQCQSDLQELAALRRRIANKTVAGPGKEDLQAHQQSLRQWNEQREALETKLATEIPEVRLQQHLQDVSCQSVARKLPPDAALVEIVRFNAFDFHAVAERLDESHWRPPRQWQPARYLAFILHGTGQEDVTCMPDNWGPCHEIVDLGEAEPIDRMIASFRSEVIDVQRGLSFGNARLPDATGDVGRALRAVVFDPIACQLGDSRRLFLAPDGELNLLPFGVLPTDDDDRLVDHYQISHVTTGRDVLRFGRTAIGLPTEPLVVADPDYDLSIDDGEDVQKSGVDVRSIGRPPRDFPRDGTTFRRLPATEAEGQHVAALVGTSRLWLRDAALDAKLKAVRSPRILHLATHGFFLEDRANDDHETHATTGFQGLQTGPAGTWSIAGVENPLVRSGLALAGINTWLADGPLPADAEDGILTAEDVTGMDLLDTELVVLSACETGVGEVRSGEGVFGLRRAFVLAGARRLVMSLWKVPDSQTQELMDEVYRHLRSGLPPAESLQQAQLTLQKRYPDPYYWGAFICQGDPAAIDPF
ncbi:MAG: CHAT domain-containing protein [Pirellulaceae bacterium]|nr:CHAT domain-containing protein [Pirellulaceae bacterium]